MSAVSHSKIYSQNETANTNNVLSIRQKDDHRQRQPAIFPKLYKNSSRPDRKTFSPHSATWILHGIYGSVIAGAGFFRKIRTILLPLLHNSSVSAVLAAFGGSVFNLAITTILYPPNYSTLPVYISDSYNDLKFGYAAAATMVGGAFIVGIMMLLEVVLNAGQVFVRGKEMSSPHRVVPIEQRDMNMVFQDFALWPHMKARDNIIYGLKVRKTDKAQMQEKLHEVKTLLHLDVQLRIEMRTEMAQLFRQLKTTVFHITHDPSEAFAMADRIIVMNQGVIDQIATPAECYESPRTITVAGLLGAGSCVHGAVMEGPAGADDAEVGSAEQAADGSDRENRAVVSMQNRKLVCKSFQNVKKGQKMLLKFRPEECIFVEKECKNAIPVRVVMSSFEGGQYRVKVETDGGDTFFLLHPTFLKEQQTGYAQILLERLYAYEEISG